MESVIWQIYKRSWRSKQWTKIS